LSGRDGSAFSASRGAEPVSPIRSQSRFLAMTISGPVWHLRHTAMRLPPYRKSCCALPGQRAKEPGAADFTMLLQAPAARNVGGSAGQALHQCRDMAAANRNARAVQQIAQHSAPCEGVIQMQLVDPPHDLQVLDRDGPRLVIDGAPADVQSLRLLGHGKIVIAVDHRFALSGERAFKKSFSSVSSRILACGAFKSTAGAPASLFSCPKTPAASPRILAFHCVS